jgi:hypothetical protein
MIHDTVGYYFSVPTLYQWFPFAVLLIAAEGIAERSATLWVSPRRGKI